MKHKFLSLFIATVAMTILNSPTFASVTINGIAYELYAPTATVVRGGNYTGTIVIPSSVEYNSATYSVTSIGYSAFYGCSGLTSVTIPNSVTSIDNYAFERCSGLTSIEIPNSVTSIGDRAFYLCSGLTSPVYNAHVFAYLPTSYSGAYTIPDGIESIAGGAFYECTGLTSVTIPNSVTSIGSGAFRGCNGLTSPVYNAHVFAYLPTSYSGVYTIPDGIESIAGDAFSSCTSLTSVTIPGSVTSIGDYAFLSSGLTSPVYNTHVFAFMPTSYSGAYTIPDGIESIAGGAFSYCRALTSVTIPNSVTSIGEDAFYGCSGLTSIEIPNSVTNIGGSAFRNCTGLTSIDIPNSVTNIGGSAFRNCTGLTSIEIPNSVTGIGDGAFYGCSGLTSVTIEAEIPPTLGSGTHFWRTNDCPIYVPCGTLYAYKTAWSNYASRIQYGPLEYHITGNVNIEGSGNVQLPQNKCEDVSAAPNYGYHFVRWNDGNTDNPRTIVLASDTTFTAEFAKNTYTISTTSANPEWGTTAGDTTALYLDEVAISATANYGYHFLRWNDYNTSNPRTMSVTEDKTYTATFAKNVYSITKNAEHGTISGNSSAEYLDEVTLSVSSDYGYHFAQWSDGNTDNPRTIILASDTTFTAEFAKNSYTISTTSANPEWGTTAGDTAALYLDEVEISAIPNYGYHFVRWNDYNTSNPRMVTVTEDMTYTATFSKDIFSITKNAEHGSISGNSSAEYLDEVTLSVSSDYGYYFAQWADGNTDNPRTFVVTQDTTMEAIFDYLLTGKCGKDNALTWTLDSTTLALTISGNGALTENYTYGNYIESLTIGDEISPIGQGAFQSFSQLKEVTLGTSLKVLEENAFANCRSIETITCYSQRPPTVNQNALYGLGYSTVVYVPAAYLNNYLMHDAWGLYDVRPMGVALYLSANNAQYGVVEGAGTYASGSNVAFSATPDYGYHFAQWSDGNMDNPRTIVLTQDTTFVAEFAPNKYSVNVSCDPSLGSIVGKNGEYDYLSRISYEAVAHYGYQFAKWSDGNTQNPRTVIVQRDTTLVAEFAKRSFTLTTQSANPEQGIALGGKSALYLEEVEISATPNDGYTFVQWSDGDAKNPRIVVLTQDTTFVAEFAVAKSGLCGANNSLTWSYTDDRTLTISGSGALTENYTFGVEAPTQMKTLIIGNEVTAIGERAFYGKSNINHLVLGAQLATIGDYAFAECRNFDDITCYATTVPAINETTFANVGNKQYIYLYVPAERERAYKRDIYWGEFDVQIQEAEKTTVTEDEVTVAPADNSAVLTWPTNENAASYTIEITKDGEVFCRLVFNANGQLTGIAFAPSPNGTPRHAPTALMTANGLQFTVTGLNSGTNYGYSVTTKDANDQPIASYSGEFTTTGEVPTSVDQVPSDQVQCTKILRNGQILILRSDKTYTVTGQEVK